MNSTAMPANPATTSVPPGTIGTEITPPLSCEPADAEPSTGGAVTVTGVRGFILPDPDAGTEPDATELKEVDVNDEGWIVGV
jgi:hypothetical protein